MRPRLSLPLLAALVLLVPACTTLGGPAPDSDEPDRRRPPRTEEPAEEPADEPRGPRTVQGFRIQILTTSDKAAADQGAADAEAAWQMPVEVAWRAPYYRVRVGAFGSRADAERRLAAVQEQYPDAFLVPDTVTLYPD